MKNSTLIFIFLFTTLASFAQNQGRRGDAGNSNTIVGTWKVIEFSNIDTVTHTRIHPYGRNPKGYFTYSKNGIVNINVSSEIPLKIPVDSANNFKIGLANLRKNYALAYFGTYTIEQSKNGSVVVHHVTGGIVPEYIGTEQRRPFTVKNDTLTIDFNIWKRVLVRVD